MTDITQVEISRRNFIKGMLGLAAAIGIPNLPTVDELPPITTTKDVLPSKDEILEWAVDDSAEEIITIKQSDNYIGTIRIGDKTYPLLSVDIRHYRQPIEAIFKGEWSRRLVNQEISIDFFTDIAPVVSGDQVDIELSVYGTNLALKGEGYCVSMTGFQRIEDFYLYGSQVQLVGEPEFVI